jgi:ABC-2 type transport system ATP-binding protein
MSNSRPNRHPKPSAASTSRHPAPPSKAAAPAAKTAKTAKPPTKADTEAPKAAPRKPAAFFSVDELGKTYGDLVALAPLDLRVDKGEALVLLGHNGSGKTTFLRMAAGLLDPTGGTASVGGDPVGSLPARERLAYLSDSPTFYEDLSVWEHLELIARIHGVDDWQQDAADLLGHLGLYDRADDLPVQFSRGLKQKAAIAMAFIRPFELLLVDEPFVGLDAAGKQALLELLDDQRDHGATLVVATHELAFVERVPRCVALRDGTLIFDGPTEGIDVLSLVT